MENFSIFNASLGSTVDSRSCVSHGGVCKNFTVFLREGGLWILRLPSCPQFLGGLSHVCRAVGVMSRYIMEIHSE